MQEDLDIKVLRIQNKNLSERLVQRQKLEASLRDKIEKLQNRKVADDNKLCIFDRYWTQLDEDLGVLLERAEAIVASSGETTTTATTTKSEQSSAKKESSVEAAEEGEYGGGDDDSKEPMIVDTAPSTTNTTATTSTAAAATANKTECANFRNFLAKLENWDRVDLEDNLKERVKFTTQTVAKLMTNHEKLVCLFTCLY